MSEQVQAEPSVPIASEYPQDDDDWVEFTLNATGLLIKPTPRHIRWGGPSEDAVQARDASTAPAANPPDTSARAWAVAWPGGSIEIALAPGTEPEVGQVLRLYGLTPEGNMRGLFLAGQRLLYRTVAEQADKERQARAAIDEQMREQFEHERANLDARVANLPPVFQRRIERFRVGNADFRWRFEAIEIFVCEQARLIGDHFRLRGAKALAAWMRAPLRERLRQLPALSPEHDPVTFGAACALARAYVWDPLLMAKAHGALVTVVGCEAYGCHPKEGRA